MVMKSLESAFIEQLADIYYAEKELTNALPKMAEKASRDELKQAFQEHLEETKQHVSRLEKAFQSMGQSPQTERCEAMDGLVEEGEEMISADASPDVRDALLIGAAQKVEHYEIATYGTLCTWAEQLELKEASQLLGENLNEEKSADEKLTRMAEKKVNPEAMRAS